MRRYIDIIESELVSEIIQVGPLDGDEEEYQDRRLRNKFREFNPRKASALDDGNELWIAKTPTENVYAFSVDAWGNPIAFLDLDKLAPEVFQVRMIYVAPDKRGSGVAYALYCGVLQQGFSLASDRDQTPGGRAIWAKLVQDHRVHVYAIDAIGDSDGVGVSDIDELYNDPKVSHFAAEWWG